MTKTLIEQWREGTLPNGDYYIKVRGSLSKKDFFAKDNCIHGKWDYTSDGNIIDIIEQVPSYDKYKELVQKVHILEKRLEVSEKEHYRTLERLRIATKALKEINKNYRFTVAQDVVYKALKEMEGVK